MYNERRAKYCSPVQSISHLFACKRVKKTCKDTAEIQAGQQGASTDSCPNKHLHTTLKRETVCKDVCHILYAMLKIWKWSLTCMCKFTLAYTVCLTFCTVSLFDVSNGTSLPDVNERMNEWKPCVFHAQWPRPCWSLIIRLQWPWVYFSKPLDPRCFWNGWNYAFQVRYGYRPIESDHDKYWSTAGAYTRGINGYVPPNCQNWT